MLSKLKAQLSRVGAKADSRHLHDPFRTGDVDLPIPRTILDIGASHGQFAREALWRFPDVVVHAFEPIPECFQEVLALQATCPRLHVINAALSDHEGTAELRLSRFRDSSSLQDMLPAHVEAWPHTEVEARIPVTLRRLDGMASELELVPPIMAKLDVQGHELAVIRGGRETLARCDRLMIECSFRSLYAGQPSFSEIYEAAASMGLVLDGFINSLRHPRTGELMSADVVFFRDLAKGAE